MTVCYDDTSIEAINNNNLTTDFLSSNTISLRQLSFITADFEKGMSGAVTDTLSKMTSIYGELSFYNSLISYNNFILEENVKGTLVSYPDILNRVSENVAITPIEYAEFLNAYLYSPASLVQAISVGPSKLIQQINSFYGGRFSKSSMGAFCALAPAVFGIVGNFFSSISNLATKITDIINGIANFSLSNMLDQLKKKIIAVVEKQIENIKSIIENFSVSNLIDSTATFINSKIIEKALMLKDEAMQFFSKTNIDAFMKRIEGLISYAANIFKNPTIEEIQFLIYRFCSFASKVEDIIHAVKNPLDEYTNSYRSAYNILKTNSGINTSRAVSSGALRYDQTTRKYGYDAGTAAAVAAGNPKPVATADIDGVTSWNDGKGDSRITFAGQWVSKMGEEGWIRVDPKVRVYLMRLQTRMGKQLIIKSGYRSKEYNDYLRSIGIPAAKNSLHMQGMACDVGFAGFDSQSKEQLIQYALEEGFSGIGRYSNFVHVDIGPRREWNGGY